MVIIALLSPVLGTIADLKGEKKKMLGGFWRWESSRSAAMFFIYQGDWILASAPVHPGEYRGQRQLRLLRRPSAARCPRRRDRPGFDGRLCAGLYRRRPAAGAQPGVVHEAGTGSGCHRGEGLTPAQATLPTRLAFLSVAVWWLVFSIPLFRRVSEPDVPPANAVARQAFPSGPRSSACSRPLEGLRGHRQAFLMLLAFLIYNDGIGTIIRMADIYGKEIGIDRHDHDRAHHDRAVRRDSVCVPLRDAGRPDRRQAIDCASGWSFTS